ncbi:unnamed protein product [Protopolystoma xenopodis]|uniref:Uncharacterized protein n=1 Tax=Protopolystoma xenopodis TaxID=117903 RepID=A0A3S5AMR5_9PLAT|nr:unnamed protein product [Protopolystoma xenopodis]
MKQAELVPLATAANAPAATAVTSADCSCAEIPDGPVWQGLVEIAVTPVAHAVASAIESTAALTLAPPGDAVPEVGGKATNPDWQQDAEDEGTRLEDPTAGDEIDATTVAGEEMEETKAVGETPGSSFARQSCIRLESPVGDAEAKRHILSRKEDCFVT